MAGIRSSRHHVQCCGGECSNDNLLWAAGKGQSSRQTIKYARLATSASQTCGVLQYSPTYGRAFRCYCRCIDVSSQLMRAPSCPQPRERHHLSLPFQNPPHVPQLRAKPGLTSVGASAPSTIHSFASRANFPGRIPASLTTDGSCPTTSRSAFSRCTSPY